MSFDLLTKNIGHKIGEMSLGFRVGEKTEEKPPWDYFFKRDNSGIPYEKKISLLSSNIEIGKCYRSLLVDYGGQDWERQKAIEKMSPESVRQMVRVIFDLYLSAFLFQAKKANIDQFRQSLNAYHSLVTLDYENFRRGVVYPVCSYLEHHLKLTSVEEGYLQGLITEFMQQLPVPSQSVEDLEGKAIDFSNHFASPLDKQLANSSLSFNLLDQPRTLGAFLLFLGYPASILDIFKDKLLSSEKQALEDLLKKASPTFVKDGVGLESFAGENRNTYVLELCEHIIEHSDNLLIRSEALKGISQHLYEIESKEMDTAVKIRVAQTLQGPGLFFKNDYLPQASEQIKESTAQIESLYGADFLYQKLIPTLFAVVDAKPIDYFGFVRIFGTITDVLRKGEQQDQEQFLIDCYLKVADIDLPEPVAELVKKRRVNINELVRLSDKNLFRKNEVEQAFETSGDELLTLMEKINLSAKEIAELAYVWVATKNWEIKDVKEAIRKNVSRNIRAMLRVEEVMPGAVKILMAEPFNIRFFDRHNFNDLVDQAKKVTDLRERKEGVKPYNPNRTLFVTYAWYDNNDAFYGETFKKFLKKARQQGIEVLIAEYASPAQFFRTLKGLFEVNQSNQLPMNWIFRTHAGVEGGIRIGVSGERESTVLPSALEKVKTEKMKQWFGDKPVRLMLDGCYVGEHWVKKIAAKLGWPAFGPNDSAWADNFDLIVGEDENLIVDAGFYKYDEYGRTVAVPKTDTRH